MNVGRRLASAGNVEIAATRRAAADEDRIPLLDRIPGNELRERVDARAAAEFDAAVDDVADLLVDDAVWKAKLRNLRAHHAAGLGVAVEHDALVAERREIARDGQRRGACADQCDALAVARLRRLRQPRPDIFLVIGGDALQPADGHRLRLRLDLAMLGRSFLDAATPARRLARPIARASEDSGKHVRLPVDEVRVAV